MGQAVTGEVGKNIASWRGSRALLHSCELQLGRQDSSRGPVLISGQGWTGLLWATGRADSLGLCVAGPVWVLRWPMKTMAAPGRRHPC